MDSTGTAVRDASATRTGELVRIVWTDLSCAAVGHWRAFLSHPFAVSVVADERAAVAEIDVCPPDLLCVEVGEPPISAFPTIAALARQCAGLPLLVVCRSRLAPRDVGALLQRATAIVAPPIEAAALRIRVLQLARAGASRLAPVSPLSQRTSPAIDLVAAMFPAPVAVAYAAARCHLSVSQFSRLFRREHGQSFKHFVIGYRIDRACEQLTRSPSLLKQVGFDVGFNDCAYFSRAFRRRMGISPRDYRAALVLDDGGFATRADLSNRSAHSF